MAQMRWHFLASFSRMWRVCIYHTSIKERPVPLCGLNQERHYVTSELPLMSFFKSSLIQSTCSILHTATVVLRCTSWSNRFFDVIWRDFAFKRDRAHFISGDHQHQRPREKVLLSVPAFVGCHTHIAAGLNLSAGPHLKGIKRWTVWGRW